MEKINVKLLDLFNVDSDRYKDLSELYVQKVDIYKAKASVNIIIDGVESLSGKNSLVSFVHDLENDFGTRVNFTFKGFDDINFPTAYEAVSDLIKYYVARDNKNEVSNPADNIDLKADVDYDSGDCFGYVTYINILSGWALMLSDSEKKNIIESVREASYICLGTDIPGRFEIETIDPDIAGSDLMPDDIYQAMKELKFEDYEVPADTGKGSGKKNKSEKKEDSDTKPNKNSWEAKAQQLRKEAKQEEKKFDYKAQANADNQLYGKVKKQATFMKIANLTIGCFDVNIAGNLIFNEDSFKLAKTGRSVIVKFMCLDDTDGISCIAFLKPEEADGFQKEFGKGGYVGIQGNVENDSFTGDKCLKVSGFFSAEKPPKRKDTAERKRVELHVHTKMSESDATTDPADLIKLAAQFGHSACAVTDHGVVQAFPHVFEAAKGINKKRKDTGEAPIKCILGCEGYLVDDGPTVFYNLPYDVKNDKIKPSDVDDDASLNFIFKPKAVGSFVSIVIKRNGDDALRDTFTSVCASKYRLKGYKAVKPEEEGESDQDAMEFASHDIDKSLWDPSEVPEELRDENITKKPLEPHEPLGMTVNIERDVKDEYADGTDEVIPSELVFEHVADFHAEFEDAIYPGTGEPCDSYFAMGELLEFIGDSYITGPDIFTTLAFLRRAGYGINIEDQVYYRHKFLMPATSDEDILETFYKGEFKTVDEALSSKGTLFNYTAVGSEFDDMFTACYKSASLLASCLIDAGTVDALDINYKVGHYTPARIKSNDKNANKLPIAPMYHIIYLVRSNMGLYNLYRIVSESQIHYYARRPRTPKSLLKYFKSGIIVGGACERGEIYRYVITQYRSLNKDRQATREFLKESEEFSKILSLYDYVEIQPLCNNMFITRQDPSKSDTGTTPMNEDDIRIVNELLVETADDHGMPVCATTDSHFLNKEDGRYRKYMLMSMGFDDAEMQSDLYFRTTDEMLEEFKYLGEEKAMEVVVDNTNMIADMIEFGIKPFPDGSYPPQIARAAADVRDIAYTKANRMYRHKGVLNEVVKARLDRELDSIINNGYAIMYYIAYRLVKKSNNDGYVVGSRGSVGSSFAATMCGISEVNPLPPHYRCKKCNYAEFDNSGKYGSGYDLPPKNCPECGEPLTPDGQDIPFETFLGFKGDKQPDIDLNFSGEYQPRAHAYVGVLFGGTHTFKAGTIGAYQDKNAYGVCRKICEEKGEPFTQAHLAFMARDIIGVKRTTSQHPGGIVVIAKEMDIYEFTPIQFPANKTDCGIITTHFDFRAMHDTILKLDILGHADPTVLRMLSDITGVNITDIPIPDEKVMSLLVNTDALGFPIEATDAGSATLGLSELGTNMARGMIKETKPTRFYDLVQLMGLSHGTDVWTGNAQDLIRAGTCDLNSVIGCRDSIMTSLIYWGLPNKDAFDIMEGVRKGKVAAGKVEKWPEYVEEMKKCGVPDWYIESCQKIKYMFPKAHAAAYSISTLRVAWFKVYYPEEYYCSFFTHRGEGLFNAEDMCNGPEKVKKRRIELADEMHAKGDPNTKLKYYFYELVEEMYARGITFAPITLNDSLGKKFAKAGPKLIRPPFCAIPAVSPANGEAIEKARAEAPFKNRDDFMKRTGVGQSVTQKLLDYGGILDDLPESAQINLFDLM
ncbi:DNA polymerase III, alpha chain [Ruminococcaceae bacterium YAD3003]|nr:DNA polymerase III, alpha chain [Ruminococcaceae bacterium YAD3003]